MNISGAVKRVAKGRVLVTDRLHAAVFAALLGIPVIALDNSYGKVSSIYNDYMGTFDGVHFANSDEEVTNLAGALIGA